MCVEAMSINRTVKSAMCGAAHHMFDQMIHPMGNWDNLDNEQGASTWLPERQVISDGYEVFAEMPHLDTVWDEDVQGMPVQDGLLKQLSLGTDNFVGEDWVSAKQQQLPIQASVVCDGAVQQGLEELPGANVVDMIRRNQQIIAQHLEATEEVLMQLTLAQRSVHKVSHGGHEQLLSRTPVGTQRAALEPFKVFRSPVASKRAAIQVFGEMSYEKTVWDDESIDNNDSHDGLLQQLAQGGEYLDAVRDDMHHKDIMWDEELEQDPGSHGGLLQLLADGGKYRGEECPEQVVDEVLIDYDLTSALAVGLDAKYCVDVGIKELGDVPPDIDVALSQDLDSHGLFQHLALGGLLKKLTPRMECIYDKNAKQGVRLATYQPPTKSASKGGSNIPLLRISKWLDSFDDSESMELHMTTAQIGKLDSKEIYADPMIQKFGTESYQLSGYISSDLMVLDRRQEAGNACKILREMQSWILNISSPWYQINSIAIYLVNMKHKESMSIRQWDPGITRLVMQGINCNSKCCTESYLWTECYEVVCKEFLNTATAWGQAVFRGGGNVMTRIWPRGSSIVKPIRRPKSQPKSKPGADSMVYTRQLLTGRETSIRY